MNVSDVPALQQDEINSIIMGAGKDVTAYNGDTQHSFTVTDEVAQRILEAHEVNADIIVFQDVFGAVYSLRIYIMEAVSVTNRTTTTNINKWRAHKQLDMKEKAVQRALSNGECNDVQAKGAYEQIAAERAQIEAAPTSSSGSLN